MDSPKKLMRLAKILFRWHLKNNPLWNKAEEAAQWELTKGLYLGQAKYIRSALRKDAGKQVLKISQRNF